MNALPVIAALDDRHSRARPFANETFDAFKLYKGEAIPISSFATFDEAVQMALLSSVHKANFAVRRTDTLTGAAMLHIYVVKQKSKPTYVYADYQTRRVNNLYAEHVADVKLTAPLFQGRLA